MQAYVVGKGASSGVGFAIPIDSCKGLVEQILQYGRVVRPTLGITIAPPQVLRQIGQQGVLILDVPSGVPASRSGLRGTYRWETLINVQTLYLNGKGRSPHSQVCICLNDAEENCSIKSKALRSTVTMHALSLCFPCATGNPCFTAEALYAFRDQSGQVILGDIIQGINGKKVTTQRELFEALDVLRPGDRIILTVSRDGQEQDLTVTLGGREIPLDQ